MPLAFTPMDLLKAPYNSASAISYLLLCTTITTAVNTAAHKALNVKEKTYQSDVIRIGAFMAGVSVSLLLPNETLFILLKKQ